MKTTTPIERLRRVSIALALIYIVALIGCADNTPTENSEGTGTGDLSFRLVWNSVQSRNSDKRPDRLVTGDACEDYNIQWIYAQAVDQSGEEQTKAMWPCSQHQGRLSGVPAGTYRVIIQGEVSGHTSWRGELTGVQVTAGNSTDAGSVQMTHLYDQAAPVVVQTTPEDGEKQVPVNTSLMAVFDDAIVEESITTENFKLTYLDNSDSPVTVPCTVSYESTNHIAILSPIESLREETQYTATIAVDQDPAIEDLSGNIMQKREQWTFTTFQPDHEAPYVQSRVPADAALGVSLSPSISISFSEAVNPLTISTDSIYLQHNGETIAASVYYDSQNDRAILNPTVELLAGSTYTVVATTGVADLAGNPLADIDSWSFVTQFAPWHTETIVGVQSNFDTAIALDNADNVYISFQQGVDKDLLYITQTAEATWDIGSIASSGDVGSFHDTVIDMNNGIHSAFYNETSSQLLYYYERLVTGPARAAVVEDGNVCQRMAIAVDSQNLAHICYYDATHSQLRYSSENLDWSATIIDTGGNFPAIAMAATGEGHVSYFDSANGKLRYATNAGGATWISETVDAEVNVEHYSSITVDASGYPHISYVDVDGGHLKYAAKQPSGRWQIETADASGLIGPYSDIALDSKGLVHISYSKPSNGGLMYANRTAMGIWHTQTVEAAGASGAGSSIVVDSHDDVHISHCDFDSGTILNYATTRPQN
jgi:hypothetical protein